MAVGGKRTADGSNDFELNAKIGWLPYLTGTSVLCL